MTQYQFNMGTSTSDKGALTWNPNGTLGSLQITDQIVTTNNQTCNFNHDDLVRIANANCGTPWAQTFTYDPFGNITKSGSISWMPGYYGSSNHYTIGNYDGNGNVTSDTINTYFWSVYGTPATINSNSYSYDAFRRVVEANGTTQIVYDPTGRKLALMSGSTLTKAFIPLPSGAEAVYTSSGLAYYRHKDWRGSSPLATTPSRTKYYDVAYAPFGESYNPSGTTDLNFTGDNQDMFAGLFDTPNREYQPNQGRWLSPDPAGIAVVSPIIRIRGTGTLMWVTIHLA